MKILLYIICLDMSIPTRQSVGISGSVVGEKEAGFC
jgi:hypothetical protein